MVADAASELFALRVTAFGRTDPGLVRAINEDAFGMVDLETGRRWPGGSATTWSSGGAGVLLEVSDGVGGANAGEVASALSVEGVLEGMIQASKARRPDEPMLRAVIERVSKRIHQAGQRPDRRGMGATLTAVLVQGRTAFVAQIGDSRAYVLRGRSLVQITHDQSYVQMLVDAGFMSPEEASASPRKNIILQVMGQKSVQVALGRMALRPGDRLLLCSDGLTNVLDDEKIREVASPPADLVRAATDLVERTRQRGAPDNVTVILADVA